MNRRISLLTLILCFAAGSALGAASSRDMQREAEIEKDLAQAHPELVQPLRAGRIASDKGDNAAAEPFLRIVVDKAPDYDVGLRRLGSCLVRLGKRTEGLELCQKAVTLKRSAENLSTLAYNLVADEASQEHLDDYHRALQLLHECRFLPNGTDFGTVALTAQVALAINARAEFESASELLARKYPNQMVTHYFGAINAALGEHWLRAENEIGRAEKLGLSHEAAEKFLASGIHSHASWSRIILDTALLLGLWAAGLALLFALGVALSKLTLRQAARVDLQMTVTPGERRLRKLYRVVLNVAGIYYYISLPVVLVLVVGVVAVVLYAFLAVGQVPLKLMLVLVIGALVTIVAMLKSLFIRIESAEPGRPLQRAEAEGLWQLAEEVAQSVGTRPVDEIRITPGTELAVYERGTWRQKLRNQARRILLLGAGVLDGFKQNNFRCVLAHEYGHFSHRDTAGGDIALRVRQDIMKFYFAMRAAGQATYINAAFHFLRVYNFIFRRISHGATRLQEILADRVAAQIYGAAAFEGGLTHVIHRSIEFEAAADGEIKQSIEASRPLQNLYQLAPPQAGVVAAEFEKSLNRLTSEDDTHPGPRDRFRLIARFQQPSCAPRPGDVWDLFKDPDALRAEMLAEIEKRVAPHRPRPAQSGSAPAPVSQA